MEKTAACHGGGGGGGSDDPDPFLHLLHLPEEVLIQILVRQPIVSLLRLKSVCKSWRALIQTSFFIHLHTTFNSSSSKFGSFILKTDNISSHENVILMLSECEGSEYELGSENGDWYRCTDCSWHKFTTTTGGDDDQLLLKVDNLELPSCYKGFVPHGKDMTASCNGLICLHDFHLRDVNLWNPATRQFRILPKSITNFNDDFGKCGCDFVALGFDVKTKDYKVLLITNYYSINRGGAPKILCRAQVYSLSTDSWRLINSPLALPVQNHGLYLNGSCFFMARVNHPESNTDSWFINSFDFTKEIFTIIQLPDPDEDRQDLYLRCLGGGEKMSLLVFTTLRKTSDGEYEEEYYYCYDHDGYEDCDIWVLNEHGCAVSKESWTKLHSFQIKNSRLGLPIGISNNGKFAFLQTTERSYTRRIQLYNLVTKEVKLDIPFSVMNSKVCVYKPSLVSVNSGNGAAAAPGGDKVIGGAV